LSDYVYKCALLLLLLYIKTFHLLLVQLNDGGKAFSQNCWPY